jgi:enoyl-CoA hydratase/carnithine racemase
MIPRFGTKLTITFLARRRSSSQCGIVMDRADWIDAGRLRWGDEPWQGALALIDLNQAGDISDSLSLPPCPVIGFGDAQHPLAGMLDAVAETAGQLDAIKRQVTACPNAAAVIVQLLRILPGLSLEAGLACESMAYGVLQGSAAHFSWLAGRKGAVSDDGTVDLRREGDRLEIILNRSDAGNAINRTMRDQLRSAFVLAALDDSITQLRLSGAGRTFCLGAERVEFGTTSDPATAHRIRSLTLPAYAIARCADRLEVHVQGGCVGAGLEMAGFARRITAEPDAWFQLPELAMGVLPGAGGCVSLSRRIGRQRTALMILSGRRFSARQALHWGLIDAIAADKSGADMVG